MIRDESGTYCQTVDDDPVFKALADSTRRHLLDRLFERDGRTLTELEMTRFGVMEHLRVLEEAGLVAARRQGRAKLHFLNPVPIRCRVSALVDLENRLCRVPAGARHFTDRFLRRSMADRRRELALNRHVVDTITCALVA